MTSPSKIKVKCKTCGMLRILPPKYEDKFQAHNWKNDFICYKVKLRNFKCYENYTFPKSAFLKPVK